MMTRFLDLHRFKSLFLAVVLLTGGEKAVAEQATPIGNQACKGCHAKVVEAFGGNIHNRLKEYGMESGGCESCHGPGGRHAETGDPAAIINPATLKPEALSELCLDCHTRTKNLHRWKGSAHNQAGCSGCHQVHGNRDKLLAKAGEEKVCFACHVNIRQALFQRSRHPLRDSSSPAEEGKMTCSSCHNPHGAKAEKLIDAMSINDKCYECHTEKRAPVLWEHSPVKEDCLICHSAHGSPNDKLLTTRIPRLCQECHMQGRHQSGAFSTNSVFLLNRSCLNCHPMVHGSNHPSGPVLQR